MKITNKESIRNSPIVKSLKDFVNGNAFIKTVVSIAVLAFALIPFWGYLLVRWLMEPGDFWQEFAVFAISAIVLGIPQLIMISIGAMIIMIVILED